MVNEFILRDIRTIGVTVLPVDDVEALTARYENRPIRVDDVIELRDAITRMYIERGFVSSGATIADQNVSDGVLVVRVVEGRLKDADVTLETNGRLTDSFLRHRILKDLAGPLDADVLRENLELLLEAPAIDTLTARLEPGRALGESRLEVSIQERNPWEVALIVDNEVTPFVGELQARLELSALSLFGRDDPMRLRVGATPGLRRMEFDYSTPVTPDDLRVVVALETLESEVIEDPFGELDIEAQSVEAELGVVAPVVRRVGAGADIGLAVRRRSARTTILGEAFPSARNGRFDTSVVTLAGDWLDRTETRARAARAEFNVGLDLLGATEPEPGFDEDGQFAFASAQLQYAHRFEVPRLSVSARLGGQQSLDALPPSEQFEIGGFETVRGYRENALLRDSGILLSVEARAPLFDFGPLGDNDPGGGTALLAGPFVDVAYGWDAAQRSRSDRASEAAASIGLTAAWAPLGQLSLRLDFGYPLLDIGTDGSGSLQDVGIHFRVRLAAP